jgi:hypothetical protein
MPAAKPLTATRRRLLSRGDLPGSDGGLYNPGAWLDGGRIELVVRREIDYRFTPIVHAERVVLDAATLSILGHNTLVRRGYPDGARVEDCRPLRFRGETLCVHTLVHDGAIRPVLARLTDREIVYDGPIALPTETTPIEKNWVLFEHGGELHCLYRLDPLTIFVRTRGKRWRLCKRVDNGWGASFAGMLSNSANLVPFAGGHLGFWHSIVEGRYVQGAMRLDANLDLACATGVLLDGRDAAPGHKPGVLYVAALAVHGGRVLAFYGEGDAHAGVAAFDAAALEAELRRHPFVPREPITVQLDPASMGELYRAMVDIDARARDHARPVWVHVPNRDLHEVVRRFGVRGLSLRELPPRARFDYVVGATAARVAPTRRS